MWDEAVLRYSGCFTPVNLHIFKCIRINHFIIYMDTKNYLMCAYMLAAMGLSSAVSAMTPSFPASQGSITSLRTILRTCYCIAIWKTYTPFCSSRECSRPSQICLPVCANSLSHNCLKLCRAWCLSSLTLLRTNSWLSGLIGFPTFVGGTRSVIGVQAKIGF